MRLIQKLKKEIAPYFLALSIGASGCGNWSEPNNHPPQLDPLENIVANETDLITVPLTATDEDGDMLNYSLENAPEGMNINPSTNEIEWQTNYAGAGEYTVTVTVDDGKGGISSQDVIITVNNVPCYRLAFQAAVGEDCGICVMNEDGSERITLSDRGWNGNQRWSPDGSRIVYQSVRDGSLGDIFIRNSDGTNEIDLTKNPGSCDSHSIWSPDGQKLVFNSYRDGNTNIYRMNPDGTGLERLTDDPADEWVASYSPDGTQIAFVKDWDVWTMDINGTNQINRTNNPARDNFYCWSKDGSKIFFSSDRDGDYEIYSMNPDGSEQINRTQNPAYDCYPDCSPDGQEIVFYSERTGDHEIYAVDMSGNLRKLTDNPGIQDMDPKYSPDGTKISYVAGEVYPGNLDIWTMSRDGTNKTQLTYSTFWESVARWSPNKQ